MADTDTCRASILAALLNLADGVTIEPVVPCPNRPMFVTTVERGAGIYAAVCPEHKEFLQLDAGHVRSVPLSRRT